MHDSNVFLVLATHGPEIAIAALGGILPALLWLVFWLLEDRCDPEPKRYIFYCFLAGMVAVPLVLPVEQQLSHFFSFSPLFFFWPVWLPCLWFCPSSSSLPTFFQAPLCFFCGRRSRSCLNSGRRTWRPCALG